MIIRAARAVIPDRLVSPARVELVAGRIRSVDSRPPGAGEDEIDLGDHLLVPGFVDVHVHGAGGAQTSGADPDQVAADVAALASVHLRHGTTALVPTTMTEPPDRLRATVHGVARARSANRPGAAAVLGVHLEGPWIAAARAGAHDVRRLRLPDVGEFEALDPVVNAVRMVTMAPELLGAPALMRAVLDAGAVVAVGHTDADAEQVRAAIEAGARHATHLFNAMPALDHRAPGPVGVLLTSDRVTVEVIADGHHLHPDILRLVGAAAHGRVAAVTDAMAATGQPDGLYRLGTRRVQRSSGRVTLAGRATLAGSVLTMDQAVRNLVEAGWSLTDAVTAATRTPADALGEHERGRLEIGAHADVVVLDRGLRVVAVLAGGVVAHDPDGVFGASGRRPR